MATNDGSGTGPQLPAQFGRYLVRRRLGDGGMGSVYLVLNTDLQREEALKVPNFEAGVEAELRERFLREARAAAGLDHPNLCQVYDVGERDGVCYLTMRYLNGRPLSDYIGTAQPPRKAVEIVTKLAQALAAAHDKGVTHRDLKPGNVMMCAGVGPVVMDFGLAKQAQQQGRKLTRMGTIMGTPAYMPPEQVKGDLTKLGPTSDVYSLGVILFELLTGRLPFAAATEEAIYAAVLYTPPPAPSSMRPGLPALLDAVCRKAMAKAPEDRYPSMKALAADLFEYLKATPPAPGSVDLIITKGGTGNVFQIPTVAPGAAKPATTPPRSQGPTPPAPASKPPQSPRSKAPAPATPRPGRAPSSVRRPAGARPSGTRAPIIRTQVGAGGRGRGRLSTGILACGVLCFLLLVGGVGGVGAWLYVLSQKKADDSGDPGKVAVAPPAPTPTRPPYVPVNAPTTTTDNNAAAPPPDTDKTPPPAPPPLPPVQPPLPAAPPPLAADKDKAPTLPTDKDKAPPAAPPEDKDKAPPAPPDKDKAPPPPAVADKDKAPPAVADKTPPPPAVADKDKAPTKPADAAVLFFEDFKAVKPGELPKGWDGDSFAVQKDEDDRPSLQVAGRGTRFVALPAQFVKGDFQLECEFRLSGFRPDAVFLNDHHLQLEFASRSSTPVTVDVNHLGGVRLGGVYMKADGVMPYQNMFIRLTRKGDSYKVNFKVGDDDQAAGVVTIPGKGCFEQVRLGLTGGKPAMNPQAPANQFAAALYWLRITSLEADESKPPVSLAPFPAALHEDFGKVALGSLPDGWKKSKFDNLAVQATGGMPALELINSVKNSDGVYLPKADLKGDFYVDVTAIIYQPVARPGVFGQPQPPQQTQRSYVALLFKGPGTKELQVQVFGNGAVSVPGAPTSVLDGVKYWMFNSANRIRVERSSKDKNYAIRLNDALVGNVPLAVGPGPFNLVELVLFLGDGGVATPRVTGVSAVPLAPEP